MGTEEVPTKTRGGGGMVTDRSLGVVWETNENGALFVRMAMKAGKIIHI